MINDYCNKFSNILFGHFKYCWRNKETGGQVPVSDKIEYVISS